MDLRFRPMEASDLTVMRDWFARPHVREWWEADAYDEMLVSLEGRDPSDRYFVVLGERAIGYIQSYLLSDYPDYAKVVEVGADVAGVDLFIAEGDLIGQGIGTELIRRFVTEIVFARPEVVACVADPDVRNIASLRAFEKAGFRPDHEFIDPEDGLRHMLVRLDR
jgi:aminoglycoside 6'-N-acetyltransferase